MPNNRVVPPSGYSLANVPNFLRPTAAQMTVQIQPPNGIDVARVTSTNPNVIQVNQPDQFGQPQLNHEVEHGYEFSRNPAFVQQMEGDLASGKSPRGYDYGGADGLLAAQAQHKTIADFGPEQRAQFPSDYTRLANQAIAAGDMKTLDKLNKAYGPLITQLVNLPSKNDSMTTMSQQDLTPAAPGLPPSAITGIMEPLAAIGGNARVVRR
jgi:hypothetical protein